MPIYLGVVHNQSLSDSVQFTSFEPGFMVIYHEVDFVMVTC
jgi:hypothetical protein